VGGYFVSATSDARSDIHHLSTSKLSYMLDLYPRFNGKEKIL